MFKIRSTATLPNMIILGATISLLGMSQLNGALAQSVDTYGATPIYQSQPSRTWAHFTPGKAVPPTSYPAGNTASSDNETLQPIQAGNVVYVTGGIGDEERDYLHSVAKDYNLHVSSASNDGAFVGETHIVIRDRKGGVQLDANAGPIFLARLPQGSYTLEATHGDQVKTKKIAIGRKESTVHFGW